jgi:hypothetical protein
LSLFWTCDVCVEVTTLASHSWGFIMRLNSV